MSSLSTIILVPFIFAFLISVLRFYSRESASSMANFSFLTALLTVCAAGGYLLLRVTDTLPSYGTIGFGLLGLTLLGTSIARWFML